MKLFNLNKKYNILVLGSNGMLGHDVIKNLRSTSLQNKSIIGIVHGFDFSNADGFVRISHPDQLDSYFEHSIHYDFCINCAAYTNTAKIEDGTAYEESYELNALAPKYIAQACHKHGTKLIHISTDYVFSEYSKDLNMEFQDPSYANNNTVPFPKNIYGLHKLLGEQFIQAEMKKNEYVICRTSWLYGKHNNKSFIHKFLKNVLIAINEGKDSIDVTSNESSIPTCTENLAIEIFILIHDWKHIKTNIIHAVPITETKNGISRADFARKILSCFVGRTYKGLDISTIKVNDIERTAYYPINSTLHSNALWLSAFKWEDGLYHVCNTDTFNWAVNEVEKNK